MNHIVPPVDPKEDQVVATRRLLERMNPTAAKAITDTTNAAIDAQVARGTPMSPK
jgi:hypothetical protein